MQKSYQNFFLVCSTIFDNFMKYSWGGRNPMFLPPPFFLNLDFTRNVVKRQPRMDTFSLSEAVKKFFGRKNQNNKQDRNKKSKQILPQSYFLKMFKIDPLLGFPNFQNLFFLSFLVSHQKKIFFCPTNLLLFLQKNLYLCITNAAKILGPFWGGWKMDTIFPPKKSKSPISPALS